MSGSLKRFFRAVAKKLRGERKEAPQPFAEVREAQQELMETIPPSPRCVFEDDTDDEEYFGIDLPAEGETESAPLSREPLTSNSEPFRETPAPARVKWVEREPKILKESPAPATQPEPVADPFPHGIPPLFDGEVSQLYWGKEERLIFTSEKRIDPAVLKDLATTIANYLGEGWKGKILLLDNGFKIGIEHIDPPTAETPAPIELGGEG